MKIKLFSNSNIKKYVSTFVTCAVLINPIYAMNTNTFRVNDDYHEATNYKMVFLDFKDNSVFNLFSKNDLIKHNISNILFEEDKLTIDMIQKSYNMLRYYNAMELAFYDVLPISKDIVSELIRYISNYPYNGKFWSVCEIFQLTLECLIRAERRYIINLDNKYFNIEDFKEEGTIITFTKFKEYMIDRLKELSESMK